MASVKFKMDISFTTRADKSIGDSGVVELWARETTLNKIRFGEIDEVKEALQQQANRFDLATQTYMTTFFCSLKADAFRMKKLMLSALPKSESAGSIFRTIDCEEGRVLEDNKRIR